MQEQIYFLNSKINVLSNILLYIYYFLYRSKIYADMNYRFLKYAQLNHNLVQLHMPNIYILIFLSILHVEYYNFFCILRRQNMQNLYYCRLTYVCHKLLLQVVFHLPKMESLLCFGSGQTSYLRISLKHYPNCL